MNMPRWRWLLFCLALHLSSRWDWAGRLMSWCVLPEWLASPEELAAHASSPHKDAPW